MDIQSGSVPQSPGSPDGDITLREMLVPYILGCVVVLITFIIIPYLWRHGIIKSNLPTSIPDCPPAVASAQSGAQPAPAGTPGVLSGKP